MLKIWPSSWSTPDLWWHIIATRDLVGANNMNQGVERAAIRQKDKVQQYVPSRFSGFVCFHWFFNNGFHWHFLNAYLKQRQVVALLAKQKDAMWHQLICWLQKHFSIHIGKTNQKLVNLLSFIVKLFLSNPGIPGVHSMGPSLSKSLTLPLVRSALRYQIRSFF